MAPTRIAICLIASLVFGAAARGDDAALLEIAERLTQYGVLGAMMNCSVEASKASCMDAMRETRATFSGVDKSDIKDAALCTDARMALARRVYDEMKGCMENATDNRTEQAMCRANKDEVPPMMKERNLCMGREWSGENFMDKVREEAAVAAASDVCEFCNQSASDCDNVMNEEIAKALGREAQDLQSGESSKFKDMAIRQRLAESALGCVHARRDISPDATCAEPSKILHCWGSGPSSDTTRGKTEEWKWRAESAKAAAKQKLMACLNDDETTTNQKRACVLLQSNAARDVMEELMKVPGVGASLVRLRGMQAVKEAAVTMVGDVYKECRAAAADDAKRKDCFEELSLTKAVAGFGSIDVEDVLLRYRVSMASSGAVDDAAALGMKTNDKMMVRAMGAVRAAADTWVACKDGGETDADCLEVAADAFKSVAGTTSLDAESEREMKRLARAVRNGHTLVLAWRQRLQAAGMTDGTACVAAIEDKMATKCEEASAASGSEGNATKRPCRIVDSKAEYRAYLRVDLDNNRTAWATLAEGVAAWLQNKDLSGRRLGQERRLAVISEASASQDAAECAEDDQACINGEEAPTPTPSPSPTPAPSPSRDASADLAAAANLAAPVLAVVVAQLLF